MIRQESITALVRQLNETDETEDLEAKEISGADVGKSVYETICALSNEPGLEGGTILLGVKKEEALFAFYDITGVKNPDKVSSDVASACATQFNIPVRVDIKAEATDNGVVIRIDVAELPANQKPLYFKGTGLPRGAFRRIGPTDVRCSDEDIQAFFQGKASDPYDSRIIADAGWDDLDPAAISAYRKARSEANRLAEELNWSDEDMLRSLGAVQKHDGGVQITVAGLLVFGKSAALRRISPAHRVDYIRVPGKAWVSNPDAGFESLDIRGPIVSIIPRVIAAITDDLPRTLVIEDSLSGQRTETPVVPVRVIREAVVNALMHRSYEVFQPVQIVRYANRIEIKNPGYSLKSQERFAEPGSAIRNPTIAEILHETRFAETKGSGIRVMQEKMKQSGLAAPTFESDREGQEFSATFLFHHFLDESDWDWLGQFSDLAITEDQMRALIFVREVGAIDNSTYRSLTSLDTLAASKSLRLLVQNGTLKAKGSGPKAHYVAGTELESRSARVAKPVSMDANSDNMDARIKDDFGQVSISHLPVPLRVAVRVTHLRKRLSPDDMRKIIERLCDWKPQSIAELSAYLKKKPSYISQKYVAPMVSEGVLQYLYPEMPQHPGQKYQTPRLSEGRE